MIKYEVKKIRVETKTGKNPLETFNGQNNQESEMIKSFTNYEEAKSFYKTLSTSISEKTNAVGRYYLHVGKCIEVNAYDVDEDGAEDWKEGEFFIGEDGKQNYATSGEWCDYHFEITK